MANTLSIEAKTAAVSMLCEGSSIRSIERITGIHRDTIMRLGVRVGEGCKALMDSMFRNLNTARVEVDEMWGFIGAKQRTVERNKIGKDYGDVWVWVAIDAESKLVPTFVCGDRDQYHANMFMADLEKRLVKRPQVTTDAFAAYGSAVERAFGDNVDYASLIKVYGVRSEEAARRYSPPQITAVKKEVQAGEPNMALVSTSFVEKQNHTVRMHCRRLSRLTNAFSKKRRNFEAAVALHYGYYNLVKTHGTVRCTPAMEAGVTHSPWTVRQIIETVDP